MAVRQVISLCEGTIGQDVKFGRAWSEVCERLRADKVEAKKEDEGKLEQRKADGGK